MAGCFSWCRTNGMKKAKPDVPRNQDHEDNAKAVPTVKEYAVEGGKQIVQVLEAAADLVPVPYVKSAITIALAVIKACEEVTAIEERVEELKDRVCRLMLVIVNSITADEGDEIKDSISKASNELKSEIIALESNLKMIIEDLTEIKNQNRWILVFYRDLNKTKIDACMNRLTEALERFNVSHELRTEEALREVRTRLEGIYGLTQHVSIQLQDLSRKVDIKFDALTALMGAHKAYTNQPRQVMPMKPGVFHGRDEIVKDICDLLMNDETSRVCLLGPGGLGKTSVALAVMEELVVHGKFHKDNCFWVPCIEATSPNLLRQILYSSLRITLDTNNALDDILSELDSSKDPRVILLDNFETPWNTTEGSQSDVNETLRHLGSLPHVALLVTMRATFPPSEDIKWHFRNLLPTDLEACRKIYRGNNPSLADDPLLDDLLSAIGCMPFAVTLMAKLGKESQANAGDLLEEWHRAGTDMISKSHSLEASMNHSISLSVNSALLKQDPEAMKLLAILSMLPAGTTAKCLDWWAPTLVSKLGSIATLTRSALCIRSPGDVQTSIISVLPVVQSYMRLNNRISDEVKSEVYEACCSFVVDHKPAMGESTYKEKMAALASEETNIQEILLEVFPIAPSNSGTSHSSPRGGHTPSVGEMMITDALDALLAFSEYALYARHSIGVPEHALKVARANKKKRHIAEALFCLGRIRARMDHHSIACAHFEEAHELFKGNEILDLHHAGECLIESAQSLMYREKDWQELEKLLLEAQDLVASPPASERSLGRCLMLLGYTYWYAGDANRALDMLVDAKITLETHGNPADVGACLFITSRVYAFEERYSDALDTGKVAMEILEDVGDDSLLSQSIICAARYLCHMARYEEALECLKKAVLINQRSKLGSPYGFACIFEQFGYIHAKTGGYAAACSAYEEAQKYYRGLGDKMGQQSAEAVGRCEHNLRLLVQKVESKATPDSGNDEIDLWAPFAE